MAISRIKTWIADEDVVFSDLNAEFDNIIDNLVPLQFGDYSVNIAQMKLTVDPGQTGSESLATTLAGEIERLRFEIAAIKGGVTNWYDNASASIFDLNNSIGGGLPDNRISSGLTRSGSNQNVFLVPNGAAPTITIKGASTSFVYFVKGVRFEISTDVSATSLLTAPSSNNTALVNDALLNNQDFSKTTGEWGGSITIDTVGSEITTRIGEYAAFKIAPGVDEIFIAKIKDSTTLTEIQRGFFFDSSSNPIVRQPIANNDTITLLRLTWVFAKTDKTILVTYNNVTVSAIQPSSPAVGDLWLDLSEDNDKWKTFNSTVFVDADATLIGFSVQDDTNSIAARSGDSFASILATNTMTLRQDNATTISTRNRGEQISVFGSNLKFDDDLVTWAMGNNLDSGVSEAANTTYFFYVKEDGEPVISDVAPLDRTSDLQGLYHPHQLWRCVASNHNDNSSNLVALIDYGDLREDNYIMTAEAIASSLAVKIHSNPLIRYNFINSTVALADSEEINFGTQPQALSITSTATFGFGSTTTHYVFAYLIENQGNVELGLSSQLFDENEVKTSLAMSGSSDDDDFYSETARTSRPIRLMARAELTLTTAGVWEDPTKIVMSRGQNKMMPEIFTNYNSDSLSLFTTGVVKVIDYEDLVAESHSANTTVGASWAFTCPTTGRYEVTANIRLAAVTATHNTELGFRVGTTVIKIVFQSFIGTSAFNPAGAGSAILNCATGDTIDTRFLNSSGTNLNTLATATNNIIYIKRLGD